MDAGEYEMHFLLYIYCRNIYCIALHLIYNLSNIYVQYTVHVKQRNHTILKIHYSFISFIFTGMSQKMQAINVHTIIYQNNFIIFPWWQVVVYYSLRLLLAPVVETVILLDRLLFLYENGGLCPQNHVILARITLVQQCSTIVIHVFINCIKKTLAEYKIFV